MLDREVIPIAKKYLGRAIERGLPVKGAILYGSYARGDWGVGSDLDLIIIVEKSDLPFETRSRDWNVTELPVPTDVLVYTPEEWQALRQQKRFYQTLRDEAVWIYGNDRN